MADHQITTKVRCDLFPFKDGSGFELTIEVESQDEGRAEITLMSGADQVPITITAEQWPAVVASTAEALKRMGIKPKPKKRPAGKPPRGAGARQMDAPASPPGKSPPPSNDD